MTETLSYQAIRNANLARESEESRADTRKKNLLILILHFFSEQGYVEAARALEQETNLKLSNFEVCDNVSLETVLMEYEAYYHVKFNRYPKITKKQFLAEDTKSKPTKNKFIRRNSLNRHLPKLNSPPEGLGSVPPAVDVGGPHSRPPLCSNLSSDSSRPASATRKSKSAPKKLGHASDVASISSSSAPSNGRLDNGAHHDNDQLNGLVVCSSGVAAFSNGNNSNSNHGNDRSSGKAAGRPIIDIRAMINNATKLPNGSEDNSEDRLLKPLGGFSGYSMEWRELAQVISRDIYLQNPNVRWDDIIGLDNAKRLVKEAVVYPIKYPQLFTGILSPWKGLLLYGPPGTGKTLLAKAVATECQTTFFNISASSIVSKWRGDSEKLVRVLFELARFHAPSTIFLDELESLMSQRGGQSGGGEHEGSRRMKTELLVQMDGLSKSDDLVFLLAASNLPWELDHAMLRRLEKRILVGLPTIEARAAMFNSLLPAQVCDPSTHGIQLTSQLDYPQLAQETDGYSGSDIRLVCKEAAMRPVRKVFKILEEHDEDVELDMRLDAITNDDVLAALSSTKPSAKNLVGQYADWQREYESV